MKRRLREFLKTVVQRLAWSSGLPQQLVRLEQQLASVQPQLASIQQQLASVQQQADSVHQRLDFPHLFSLRKIVNETTSASQGLQVLLSLHYKELASRGVPLPELCSTEFRCFSQNGEDGLLLYLFSLIGTTNKKAVEICAGDGVECNIANLVINHGWEGLMFDGDEDSIQRGKEFFARCQDTFSKTPTLVSAWITVDNVNALIADLGFAGNIDLLSLDMDGVEHWIWKALTAIAPRAVILEFNPAWGPDLSVSIPYKSDFQIDYSKRPYYCGASLSAWVKLGRQKGYRLVGVQRLGFNAIFLRSDVGAELFPEISPAECFQGNQTLQKWHSGWIPSTTERPEWGEVVEI
jgi:hypothetical protein